LASKACVPCRGGIPPLDRFDNFRDALGFTNRVGELAEEQGHHPDIELAWGRVKLTVWTHKIDGLTESDFIWAAKADQIRPSC
jgi:4a-hydroxytetrahydrobiopterin dehydratase